LALGDGTKKIHEREKEPVRKMGKMLVYSRELKAGSIVKSDDFSLKSPRDGLSPQELDKILGKKLNTNVAANQVVKLDDYTL
jgi:sialic acid synthase SpsE